MSRPHVAIAGMGSDHGSLAIARAIARLSTGSPVIVDAPKSMQDQKETPATVLVDDTQKPPTDPALQVKPKSSCPHCYGRGFIGKDMATGKKIVCRCVKRSFERVNKLQKEMDAKLKGKPVNSASGWDAPKAPVGNPEAVPA